MTELWAVGLVLVATFVGSFGPIFLKKASGTLSLSIFKVIKNKYLFWGVVISAMGNFLFIPALRGGDLSILYPLVSTIYIWTSFWSVLILKESMTKQKWLGIFIIIVGVSLIGFGS